MIIIISPSKTQNFKNKTYIPLTLPKYNDRTCQLVEIIKQLTKLEISKIMKISGRLLDETYRQIQDYDTNKAYPAICTYTGFVFKEIKWNLYTDAELEFMNEHLRILSALYGILKPFDGIKPYRLDMNMKGFNVSLYEYWSSLNAELKDEKVVLNLASNEFSRLIKTPMVNVHFLENKDDIYKNISTYSKKARGMMVNYIIKNKIQNIEDIKKFNLDDYYFNETMSTDKDLYFIR